jgi:hypothetical protein
MTRSSNLRATKRCRRCSQRHQLPETYRMGWLHSYLAESSLVRRRAERACSQLDTFEPRGDSIGLGQRPPRLVVATGPYRLVVVARFGFLPELNRVACGLG